MSLTLGIPLVGPEGRQWAQSRTGESLAFEKFNTLNPLWQKQQSPGRSNLRMRLQMYDVLELPDRSIVERYLDVWHSSILRLVFPLVEVSLFRRTIATAYRQLRTDFQSEAISSRACIYAFLAFIYMTERKGLESRMILPMDYQACMTKAQILSSDALQEGATLDGLQTVAMLVSFMLFGFFLFFLWLWWGWCYLPLFRRRITLGDVLVIVRKTMKRDRILKVWEHETY